jgi:hypothetical protein
MNTQQHLKVKFHCLPSNSFLLPTKKISIFLTIECSLGLECTSSTKKKLKQVANKYPLQTTSITTATKTHKIKIKK